MNYSQLPHNDNPNSRIKELGGRALNDAELLAVALRINEKESAESLRDLLNEYGSLSRIPAEEIIEIKGLGEGYANSVKAITELVSREARRSMPEQITINSPADAAADKSALSCQLSGFVGSRRVEAWMPGSQWVQGWRWEQGWLSVFPGLVLLSRRSQSTRPSERQILAETDLSISFSSPLMYSHLQGDCNRASWLGMGGKEFPDLFIRMKYIL